jgi:hypothetical protein
MVCQPDSDYLRLVRGLRILDQGYWTRTSAARRNDSTRLDLVRVRHSVLRSSTPRPRNPKPRHVGVGRPSQDSDCLRSERCESIRNLWSVKMYEVSGLTYCIHLYSLWAWSAPPLWSFDPLCISTFFVPWHMSCRIISIFRRVSLRFSGSMPRIDQNGWVS